MKGKYLSPKADLTFKLVFGEHKDLLMSLLNALLPLPDDAPITSLEYSTPEMTPEYAGKKGGVQRLPSVLGGYHSVVDVCCTDARGRHFLVEMQMNWNEEFKKRVIMEKKMAVLWLRFLTEINEDTAEVPAELNENPEIRKALSIVEKSAMTVAQLYAYERFWDALNREEVLVQSSYKEGEAKGRAEGREEGRAEGLTETATRMKAKGFSIEDIAEITSLSIEEIKTL